MGKNRGASLPTMGEDVTGTTFDAETSEVNNLSAREQSFRNTVMEMEGMTNENNFNELLTSLSQRGILSENDAQNLSQNKNYEQIYNAYSVSRFIDGEMESTMTPEVRRNRITGDVGMVTGNRNGRLRSLYNSEGTPYREVMSFNQFEQYYEQYIEPTVTQNTRDAMEYLRNNPNLSVIPDRAVRERTWENTNKKQVEK